MEGDRVGVLRVVDAASTTSSTAGDTCIFQSCPRLFRGHVHTLGAWAPEFGPVCHCIIRPILLLRKWEEVSRAIFGVNMWWGCVEFPPHHFGAAQAHALATRPRHGAESPRRVYCCTLHHSSNIIVSQVGGSLEGNIRRKHVLGVCTILATPVWSRASACTCD